MKDWDESRPSDVVSFISSGPLVSHRQTRPIMTRIEVDQVVFRVSGPMTMGIKRDDPRGNQERLQGQRRETRMFLTINDIMRSVLKLISDYET